MCLYISKNLLIYRYINNVYCFCFEFVNKSFRLILICCDLSPNLYNSITIAVK